MVLCSCHSEFLLVGVSAFQRWQSLKCAFRVSNLQAQVLELFLAASGDLPPVDISAAKQRKMFWFSSDYVVLQTRVLELFSIGSGAFLPVGVFAAQQWENLNTQRADQHEQLVKVLREVQGGLTRAKRIHAVSISIHNHSQMNPKYHDKDNQSCEYSCQQSFVNDFQKQTYWCWTRLKSLLDRMDFRRSSVTKFQWFHRWSGIPYTWNILQYQ